MKVYFAMVLTTPLKLELLHRAESHLGAPSLKEMRGIGHRC